MNRTHTLLASVLLGIAFVAGCDTGGDDVSMVGGHVYPKIGSNVDVQFRRDMLGLAGDKSTTPMGAEGMSLGSGGILKRITDEFVVLQVHGEPNREIWIPRDAILLMDVKRVPTE